MSIEAAIADAVVARMVPIVEGIVRAELAPLLASLPPRFGTVEEAARVLGVCELTVRRQFKAKNIQGRKIGKRKILIDLASLRPKSDEQIAAMARQLRGAPLSQGEGGRKA